MAAEGIEVFLVEYICSLYFCAMVPVGSDLWSTNFSWHTLPLEYSGILYDLVCKKEMHICILGVSYVAIPHPSILQWLPFRQSGESKSLFM